MLHANAFIEVDKDITLRRTTRENAQQKFDLIVKNREHLLPWLPWANFYHSIYEMYEYTDKTIADFDEGHEFVYDIYYQEQLVGSIDFHSLSENDQRVEIGYWLDKDNTGKGIMSRAVAKFAEYAFTEFKLHRVEIRVAAENTASCNVATRLGYTEEGRLKDFQFLDGKFYDTIVYAKINSK